MSLGNLKAQGEKEHLVGINTFPILGNTLELGYEYRIKPQVAFDVYIGNVFNSQISSFHKIGTRYKFEKRSGAFIKVGARYNFKLTRHRFLPFVGANMVNAIAFEEAIDEWGNNELVSRDSYNLGVSGIFGFTGNLTKRIELDLGFQYGWLLSSGLLDFFSYMPGMGGIFNGNRMQGVARIKYRI